MQIETIWVVLAIILVLLELWAIRGVMKSGARSSSRLMWIAIIIFAPLLGMLLCAPVFMVLDALRLGRRSR